MLDYSIPISVKGIVFDNDEVWLRKNERNEWELPGGKLEATEQPEDTIVREMNEELGFTVEVTEIIQSYKYSIESSPGEKRGVLVVSYLCKIIYRSGKFEAIGEAGPATFKKFSLADVASLNLPEFYKIAIQLAWNKHLKIGEI